MLEISLVEHAESLLGESFIFQQDNAAIHNSRVTREWLAAKNIEVLKCPACSPDLKPIEKLWGIILRQVYRNGKQFQTTEDLKQRIWDVWNDISPEILQNLITSMPNHLFEVILKDGGHTHY